MCNVCSDTVSLLIKSSTPVEREAFAHLIEPWVRVVLAISFNFFFCRLQMHFTLHGTVCDALVDKCKNLWSIAPDNEDASSSSYFFFFFIIVHCMYLRLLHWLLIIFAAFNHLVPRSIFLAWMKICFSIALCTNVQADLSAYFDLMNNLPWWSY